MEPSAASSGTSSVRDNPKGVPSGTIALPTETGGTGEVPAGLAGGAELGALLAGILAFAGVLRGFVETGVFGGIGWLAAGCETDVAEEGLLCSAGADGASPRIAASSFSEAPALVRRTSSAGERLNPVWAPAMSAIIADSGTWASSIFTTSSLCRTAG